MNFAPIIFVIKQQDFVKQFRAVYCDHRPIFFTEDKYLAKKLLLNEKK